VRQGQKEYEASRGKTKGNIIAFCSAQPMGKPILRIKEDSQILVGGTKIYQEGTEDLEDPQPSSRVKLQEVRALVMRGKGGGHLYEESQTKGLCYTETRIKAENQDNITISRFQFSPSCQKSSAIPFWAWSPP
jgi:hypothetical protein